MPTLPDEAARKSAKPAALARKVVRDPGLLPQLFAGLNAAPARIKYGCLRVLRSLGETTPGVLYPEIDRLVSMLESENQILKWGAIQMLGDLARVDSARKIDGILGRYLEPILGSVMITAANVIQGAAKIARAKPSLADRIAQAIMRVETANYQTPECRNVAIGHAIEALASFYDLLQAPQPVETFIRRQLDNPRSAVQRKAAHFLKKYLSQSKSTGRSEPASAQSRSLS
jgi:hypothetical protein